MTALVIRKLPWRFDALLLADIRAFFRRFRD
jgi:hypothetical protein